MASRLLINSCGVAEYRGTFMLTEDTLMGYAKSRSKTDRGGYGSQTHTFVVLTFRAGESEDFVRYVARHKLGKALRTEEYRNINHSYKWDKDYPNGALLSVCVYIPDHNKLTEWVQKQEPGYKLE